MSNLPLKRLLQSGGLSNFRVDRESAAVVAQHGNPHVLFSSERLQHLASVKANEINESHDFSKQKNREEKKKRKSASDDTSGDDDGGSSSDDDALHFGGGKGDAKKTKKDE